MIKFIQGGGGGGGGGVNRCFSIISSKHGFSTLKYLINLYKIPQKQPEQTLNEYINMQDESTLPKQFINAFTSKMNQLN